MEQTFAHLSNAEFMRMMDVLIDEHEFARMLTEYGMDDNEEPW